MKYAVTGDEGIETQWHDTEAAAIEEFNKLSDVPFDPKHNEVQGYTDAEIEEIEAYAEANPQ